MYRNRCLWDSPGVPPVATHESGSLVGASYGTQRQVNQQVEEAIVAYRREESARVAKDMPAKAITLAKDETFTGGLCPSGD